MSTPAVRVVSLQASNVLRLSALEFNWQDGQRVLTLGGRNAAGKSSVINAIAMALGGLALCPEEPLKRGEQRGFVELNLGELIVRREFWRDLLTEQPADGPPAYGETKSRLVVKNAEGIKQEPAQRLLDRLVGKLSFDPTAFAAEDEKKQAEILRQIVGLDFKDHDEQRSIAYDTRAVHNKQYKEQLVLLDAMPKYDGVPDTEVLVTALLDEFKQAEDARRAFVAANYATAEARSELSRKQIEAEHQHKLCSELVQRIADMQATLQKGLEIRAAADRIVERCAAKIAETEKQETELRKAIPDTDAIQARLRDAEDVNNKVRANVARKHVMETVVAYQKKAEEQDALIAQLDEARAKKIRDTQFPIDGLGISPTGAVTFNNIGLKQASTAEQIRVSVAIGFALNPALKLLCVRNGNALDDDSFKLVADAAEKAGGQVLMEIVTKNADDVSVFIEDGHNA